MKNSPSDLKELSNKGYLILKNCISPKLIKLLQQKILYQLGNSKKNSYENFAKKCLKLNNKKLFKIINPINKILINEGFFKKILNEKKLFSHLVSLLGSDLAVSNNSSLTINLSKNIDNYYFKDWHQEIWSGASIASVNVWTPIFQKNNKFGQMEFIENSHKWGNIPHRSRSPLDLPRKYKTKKINLSYGDVVIFSTLLVHRSANAIYPRLATSFQVKNFKLQDNTFQNKNWKIYSYSEMSKIERILGNHYLSPYRTIGIDAKTSQGIVQKISKLS